MKSFNQFILETSTKDATAMEDAIVIGYYQAQKRVIPSASSLEISESKYKGMIKNKVALAKGKAIAKAILPKVGKGNAIGFGSQSTPVTKFWSDYGAGNPTPKTDIILNKKKISLKVGPAQLMSGGKAEAIATFFAASQSLSKPLDRKTKLFAEVVDLFEGFTRGLTKGGEVANFQKFDPRPGHAGEKNPHKKANTDKAINKADAVHKKMTVKMGEHFEKHPDFHIQFIKEAISGKFKFGPGSLGFARFILVTDKNGERPAWHSSTDEKYIKKLIPRTNIKIRFKSSSQKSMGKKTGRYSYWSVVGITTKAMLKAKNSVKEELDSLRIHRQVLSEEQLKLAEDNIIMRAFNKAKDFLVNLFKKVVAWIEEGAQNMMEFLGLEPIISFNNNIDFG